MLHIISGHVDKWDNSDGVKRLVVGTARRTWGQLASQTYAYILMIAKAQV